jgi:hypothetical protein
MAVHFQGAAHEVAGAVIVVCEQDAGHEVLQFDG